MILTDDFVYVHLPKTGGTFVTEVVGRLYGDRAVNVHKHGTCSDIPASHRKKPILSCARNPFDRYVSQYRFAWWRMYPERYCGIDVMRARYPHYPDISFAEFVVLANTCFVGHHGGTQSGYHNDHFGDEDRLGWHTEQFVRFYCREPRAVFASLDRESLAAQSWRSALYPVTFLRVEDLNRELYDYLLGHGHEPDALAFILDEGKIHPAEGGRPPDDAWASYYTPTLARSVAHWERLVFGMFPTYEASIAAVDEAGLACAEGVA